MSCKQTTIDNSAQVEQQKEQYVKLLARIFPSIAEATSEIINLEAILNLPKGTEHFLSDLHGEAEAFDHILRNASGAIKRKVNELFGNTLHKQLIDDLCALIYYPEQKMKLVRSEEKNAMKDWYSVTLNLLVKVCSSVSSKYTRSKVRKALPRDFSYIIQELMHESAGNGNKTEYVYQIVETIISTGRAEAFIVALCNLIQRLTIDQLHVVGDVFDRGPGAHIIMDRLEQYHNVDIQWGNHDILWMGAAAGNRACMAGVIRMCLRYGNMATLEDGYGINLLPLATFAMETYKEENVQALFHPNTKYTDYSFDDKTLRLMAQMHKAITIIQFKLEGQIIARHPEYKMEDRLLLHLVDYEPTVDSADPYKLSAEENALMEKISHSFLSGERLQRHMQFMFRKGCVYTIANGNLLFHAALPLHPDGSFRKVLINGETYEGKDLFDKIDQVVRAAYFNEEETCVPSAELDYCWYLWCGKDSPFFDKERMTTFERYFVEDKESHKEPKGAYFELREKAETCERILDAFGVEGVHRHIINGHVPVRQKQGETPMKAEGKLIVIDGGFSRPYHMETGIAGYTLVYHSRGFQLVQHEPFHSMERAIREGKDIKSTTVVVEKSAERWRVRDTDKGRELQDQINGLKLLLDAYRSGKIKEQGYDRDF